MLVFGHRGASADAPENTLPAFLEAMAQGAHGVELDAMVCGSGEVVVCHDEELSRLAGMDWKVRQTPLWKLQRLDVGRRLGFAPARIPLLSEVLAALPPTAIINIELKSCSLEDGGLSEKVVQHLADESLQRRVFISSFSALSLLRVASCSPWLRRGLLIDPDRNFFLQDALLRPWASNGSVHPPASACTEARMRFWKRLGLLVVTWTVDDPAEAQRLEALGVDACITNRPRKILNALAED